MDPRPPQPGVPERQLTAREKEIANSIESFPFLEIKDRIFLLLIWRGLKTASPVSLQPNVANEVVEDLRHRVQGAGLLFKVGPVSYEAFRGLRPGLICFVASNSDDLNLISELWSGDHINDPRVYKEIGRMSGLPKTAIDTYDEFIRKPEPEREKLFKKLTVPVEEKEKFPELLPFSRLFFMSKAHRQAEEAVVQKWVDEIKLVVPNLYQLYVEELKRTLRMP
jgi:hypothetical protein